MLPLLWDSGPALPRQRRSRPSSAAGIRPKGEWLYRKKAERNTIMRTRIILAVVALLLVFGATIAWAEIPDSTTGAIYGCYHNTTGALRVIDAEAGETCNSNESPLDWNHPIDFRHRITTQANGRTLTDTGEEQFVGAPCVEDRLGHRSIVSGGFQITNVTPPLTKRDVNVTNAWPNEDEYIVGTVGPGTGATYTVQVVAQCIYLEPVQ